MIRRPRQRSESQSLETADWSKMLKPDDAEHVRKWVELSGLERVARIAAALTQSDRRGNVAKPDFELLLEMARRLRACPLRSTRSVASEVARESQASRRPSIDVESLGKKLEREFARARQKWFQLVRNPPHRVETDQPGVTVTPSTPEKWRAVDRIIEILPAPIDLFDAVISEATAMQPHKVAQLRRLGRVRIEALIECAMARQQAKPRAGRSFRIPRTLLDLIEIEIETSDPRPTISALP
jgi:hypothetical protein